MKKDYDYSELNLERWSENGPTAFDSAANYGGDDKSEFFVAPCSVSRDTADSVALSNWEVQKAKLESIATHEETEACCFGHWACGWYELFLIHEDDIPALEAASEMADSLENYPILDEFAQSEKECELQLETFEACYRSDFVRGLASKIAEAFELDEDLVEESLETMFENEDGMDEFSFCYAIMELQGVYWEEDSSGPYIPGGVDRLLLNFDWHSDLFDFNHGIKIAQRFGLVSPAPAA